MSKADGYSLLAKLPVWRVHQLPAVSKTLMLTGEAEVGVSSVDEEGEKLGGAASFRD